MGLALEVKQTLVSNRINELYFLCGKDCKSKEDLFEKIQCFLTNTEKKYLQDTDIYDFFLFKIN